MILQSKRELNSNLLLVMRRERVNDAVHCLRAVAGMESCKHQVAGLGSLDHC